MEFLILIPLACAIAVLTTLAAVLLGIGAAEMFLDATSRGFVGIVVFIAFWVFLFPIAICASIVWGFRECAPYMPRSHQGHNELMNSQDGTPNH